MDCTLTCPQLEHMFISILVSSLRKMLMKGVTPMLPPCKPGVHIPQSKHILIKCVAVAPHALGWAPSICIKVLALLWKLLVPAGWIIGMWSEMHLPASSTGALVHKYYSTSSDAQVLQHQYTDLRIMLTNGDRGGMLLCHTGHCNTHKRHKLQHGRSQQWTDL